MSLERTLQDAVEHLETLGDERSPQLMISYRRPESWRRDAMKKHGSPVIAWDVHISMRRLPSEPQTSTNQPGWFHERTWDPNLGAAVAEAITNTKAYVATSTCRVCD